MALLRDVWNGLNDWNVWNSAAHRGCRPFRLLYRDRLHIRIPGVYIIFIGRR